MKYQIRYRDIMSDKPESELLDTRKEAEELLSKMKEEMRAKGTHEMIINSYYIFENRRY